MAEVCLRSSPHLFENLIAVWIQGAKSQGVTMRDLLMIVFSTAFFIVALAYVKACEHLR